MTPSGRAVHIEVEFASETSERARLFASMEL